MVSLRAIERNLDFLPNEFIITADHGNLFGEYDMWGHTNIHTYIEELRKVPWYIVDNNKIKGD